MPDSSLRLESSGEDRNEKKEIGAIAPVSF